VTRITTLGGMGAAIAHEINQPLAAIAANASACRRWVEAAPPRLDRIAATIGDIAEDANRASAIIARVRGLIANAAPRREQADINDTIRQAAALVEPQLRACSVDLRLLLAADLPALMIDPVQIQQVILNLLVNASEAVEPREGDIGVESRLAKGRIIMTVEDNGPGLPEEIASMFEPFHSTKEGGIGMGLAICRSIIEAHGGSIGAALRERGLVVTISLPLANGANG
jgi:C4-dicarboxylate-specific signal transduction histidine kinase